MSTAIIFLGVLILLNAFFAASEIALISLNDARIRSLADKGDAKAARIEKLMDEPSRFLATIQIGYNPGRLFWPARLLPRPSLTHWCGFCRRPEWDGRPGC